MIVRIFQILLHWSPCKRICCCWTIAYYTLGRHNNCDRIYIAHNYFRLTRHIVRENSNFIILFTQDVRNLTYIHADHCASDLSLSLSLSLSESKQFCNGVWSCGGAGHNFVTIDLTSTPMNGKYRMRAT